MTGPDERCVGAIWVALALRSPLEDEGSVLCPDVKHRGGSHGAEVNVLFLRCAVRGRKTERPLPPSAAPPFSVHAVSGRWRGRAELASN